ncbi:MarR family winged helix-turn-helix transcriptional regulator [Sandaracinus amylolyticus]|uniref:Transcriptional regulator, MarR family protein n=1 Tax=Sandaracinus amylolyticus TaxID=927083 RepID=A0A0F6SD75_9BACT|nr:MarR family transcriptional regulator [Sandaracinus amylolyticus]AKF02954.1 Transcriptional regulator, MarR family protein [Sandaracinus amylolyticus]
MTLTRAGTALSGLAVEVFRLNGLLLEAGDRLTAPAGLTSARWQVLGVVEHEPASVADVARAMGLRRQTVQQTADALAREGLVRWKDNPGHARAKLMVVTAKGARALARVHQAHARWANALGRALGTTELEEAARMLRCIAEHLERKEA